MFLEVSILRLPYFFFFPFLLSGSVLVSGSWGSPFFNSSLFPLSFSSFLSILLWSQVLGLVSILYLHSFLFFIVLPILLWFRVLGLTFSHLHSFLFTQHSCRLSFELRFWSWSPFLHLHFSRIFILSDPPLFSGLGVGIRSPDGPLLRRNGSHQSSLFGAALPLHRAAWRGFDSWCM